jgi:hypothetical protein
MKISIWLACGVMISGCATTADFQKMMQNNVGVSLQQIQQQFGYNYIERTLDDGNSAYTWTRSKRGTTPGYASPMEVRTITKGDIKHTTVSPGSYFPPENYESVCELTFITNSEKQVIRWRAHGTGCARFGQQSYMSGGSQ